MKRTIWTLVLLSLVGLALAPAGGVIRFTVINKSGDKLILWLQGIDVKEDFVFNVALGDRSFPFVAEYTIPRSDYLLKVTYVDPQGGLSTCVQPKARKIDLNHQTRLVIAECVRVPTRKGETTMIKFRPQPR